MVEESQLNSIEKLIDFSTRMVVSITERGIENIVSEFISVSVADNVTYELIQYTKKGNMKIIKLQSV